MPRTTRSSFFSVARRPKYIGGLVFALLAASAFAWLGQWQLDRAINREDKAAELAATQPVTLNLFLDTRNVFVVDGRKQNSRDAWWVIANATDENGKSVTLALGTTDNGYVVMPDGSQLANGTIVCVKITPVTGGTNTTTRSYTVVGGSGGSLPTGQYQYMVYQMTTQNGAGFDYMRAHPITEG